MVRTPPADSQRHEAGFRRAPDHVQHGAAIFVGGGDVEKTKLVGAGGVVGNRGLDGIAGVAQVDEIDALTTRPSLTSRQGITRTLNIAISYAAARALRISASAADGSSRPS